MSVCLFACLFECGLFGARGGVRGKPEGRPKQWVPCPNSDVDTYPHNQNSSIWNRYCTSLQGPLLGRFIPGEAIWPWVITYASILGRMNTHVPRILMFTRGFLGFDPHSHMNMKPFTTLEPQVKFLGTPLASRGLGESHLDIAIFWAQRRSFGSGFRAELATPKKMSKLS